MVMKSALKDAMAGDLEEKIEEAVNEVWESVIVAEDNVNCDPEAAIWVKVSCDKIVIPHKGYQVHISFKETVRK